MKELAESIEMEQSAVSHQLRLLRTLGLVARRRVGGVRGTRFTTHHAASKLDEAVYHAGHLRLDALDQARDAIA